MSDALHSVPAAVETLLGAPFLAVAGVVAGLPLGAVVVVTTVIPFFGPLYLLGLALPVVLAALLVPVAVAVEGDADPSRLARAVRDRFGPLLGVYLLVVAAVAVVALAATLTAVAVAGPDAVGAWVAEWGVSGRADPLALVLLVPFAVAAVAVATLAQFAAALLALGRERSVRRAVDRSTRLVAAAPADSLLAFVVRLALSAAPLAVAWAVAVTVDLSAPVAWAGLGVAGGAGLLLWAAHHATYVRRRVDG